MIPESSILVMLVRLIDHIPVPSRANQPPRRGRPAIYSERLFLKALVIMILKQLHSPYELFTVLQQPTTEMLLLCAALSENGHLPTRRTFERRLATLPDQLPAQIGALGCHLVALLQPWASHGCAVAVDSTTLPAKGGVWHQKHRELGEIPHTSIDTEAHWTKSGWHGWVYGWKLHLMSTVGNVWIPLAAEVTPANIDDGGQLARLLWHNADSLPTMRYILGDKHYNTPLLRAICRLKGWVLVATKHGRYPHHDAGVEVRRVFHKLRSVAIENFNEHFKSIFTGHQQVPTRGLLATRRWALGSVLVYQLALLYRHEHGLDLHVGLKAMLKAA
jgi:hypothetical protein